MWQEKRLAELLLRPRGPGADATTKAKVVRLAAHAFKIRSDIHIGNVAVWKIVSSYPVGGHPVGFKDFHLIVSSDCPRCQSFTHHEQGSRACVVKSVYC